MQRKKVISAIPLGLLMATAVWTCRAARWGATADEIGQAGVGHDWFDGLPGARLRMTRAISIAAPPDTVWPWLAQLGRGAGWYSYDGFDNGGRASARHIVGWIPEPQVGDATAIGYLRHLDPGREIVWWSPDTPFLGARTWSLFGYSVRADGDGSRVVMRVEAVASGAAKWGVVALFPLVDSIMALRQLRSLKELAEQHGARTEDPEHPESGERDQYQLYHVIYASGDEAGVPGAEQAESSRTSAEADGVVARSDPDAGS